MTRYRDYEHGITTIDTQLVRPGFTASHLIVEQGQAALVDVAAAAQSPRIVQTLEDKGIAPEQVRYIIVTHVHLDHAGGVGTLLKQFPNAEVVVHPKGARHLINPEKLIAGATAVYGAERLRALFGEMLPVPTERIVQPNDDDVLELAGRPLRIRHTTGHARHHLCVVDEVGRGVFTGDTFGLSYREFDTEQGHFILPATAPVQFEPDAMRASIEMLARYQPEFLYLTHFGQVGDVPTLRERLLYIIDRFVEIAQNAPTTPDERHAALVDGIEQFLLKELAQHGWRDAPKKALDLLRPDLELDIMGLEVWLDRLAKKNAKRDA